VLKELFGFRRSRAFRLFSRPRVSSCMLDGVILNRDAMPLHSRELNYDRARDLTSNRCVLLFLFFLFISLLFIERREDITEHFREKNFARMFTKIVWMTCFHAAAIYMVTTVSVGFRPTETETHKQDGAFTSIRIDSCAMERTYAMLPFTYNI